MVLTGPIASATATLQVIEQYSTPTMWSDLLNVGVDKYDLLSLKRGVMSGAPCPPSLVRKVLHSISSIENILPHLAMRKAIKIKRNPFRATGNTIAAKRSPNRKNTILLKQHSRRTLQSLPNDAVSPEQQEHSARYITYSYLRNHFLVSYFLIFLFPVLDLIVALPSEWQPSEPEYWWALGLSLVNSVLTVISFADIYPDEAYLEKEMRTLSKTSTTCGIAVTELLMFASQGVYLWYTFPYFECNIRFLFKVLFNMEESEQDWDIDCYVLFLMQFIRTFCIEAKIMLAYSIRAQTCARNVAISQKYLCGAPPGENQKLGFKLPAWIIPEYN